MAKKFGDIANVNDTAFVGSPIALNTTTATTILAAQDLSEESEEQPRIKVIVQNEGTTPVKVRLIPAATTPTLKIGLTIAGGQFTTVIDAPNVYSGEISAIAPLGMPSVSVTWF